MAEPVTIWTDHVYRLVLLAGDMPVDNKYLLEVKDSDRDAMGKARWTPFQGNVKWELITKILQSAIFPPPILTPDEMV